MKLRSKFRQRLQLWWLSATVCAVGGALSLGLWHTLEAHRASMTLERLEQQALQLSSALEQKMDAYGELVYGMAVLGKSPESLSSPLLPQLNAQRYPGVEFLSLVRRMPSAVAGYEMADVWPTRSTDVWMGENAQNLEALTQLWARLPESLEPSMSEPFAVLGGDASPQRVVIGMPMWPASARSAAVHQGDILAMGLRADQLLEHFMARGGLEQGLVSIQDQGSASHRSATSRAPRLPIYVSDGWAQLPASAPKVQHELLVWGRIWSLEFAPQPQVLSALESAYPMIVGIGGLGATLVLAALVAVLSHQRLRAQFQTRVKHNLLRQQSDRLKALLHQSAIGVAEIEPRTGRYLSVNSRFSDVVGYDPKTLEMMDLYQILHPEERPEFQRLEGALAAGRLAHFTVTQRMVRADGSEVWTEVWVSPVVDNTGQSMGRQIVLLLDVTERQILQAQLHAREAYSSEMLRYMPVGLVVVGPSGNIEFVNHQFEVMTGWSQCDMADETTLWRLLCVDAMQHAALLQRLNAGRCEVVPTGVNMPAAEYLLRSKDGKELPIEVSGRFLGGRILLSFVDLSQRKAAEEEIRWLGFYDTVTQLPNRRLLLERLAEAVARCQRPGGGKGALLLLDIDNFKSLNETLGHQHGDALLRLVATRLSNCIAGQYTLARQGGDEFAVVLEDLPSEPLEAGRRAEQVGCAVLEALRTPFYLGAQDFHVTVSMGAVVFSGKSDTVEELLKRADLALYQAKSAGRDTLQFFDPSMQKAVSARVEMEKDMRLALERHEFDLYFQPQVQKDKVIGAEALLRWKHPVKGFISPSVFVPAAEESGLILPLGEWVLYAACRQLAQWAKDPQMAGLTMSVNVSPRQFYQPSFVEQVQQALRVTGAPPRMLELELTEGMLLADVEDTIRKMVQLKAMGVIFSLDDFGTGYSSLSYLKRLPLDKLKIDQSFVYEVLSSANDATIARSIIALGNSLGLQVIAEGVETEAQREFLASSGCHYWQGFLFSQPKPIAEFEAWALAYGAARTERSHA